MRRAFTLVEVIAILAVLAIVITLASVKLQGVQSEQTIIRIDAEMDILLATGSAAIHAGETFLTIEQLRQAGYLATDIGSPIETHRYELYFQDDVLRVRLEKEGKVYEKGDYRAEKTKRIYPS